MKQPLGKPKASAALSAEDQFDMLFGGGGPAPADTTKKVTQPKQEAGGINELMEMIGDGGDDALVIEDDAAIMIEDDAAIVVEEENSNKQPAKTAKEQK